MTKTKTLRSRRSSPAQRRKRPTILIVDDVMLMRMAFRYLLKNRFAAKVVEVASNAEAFRVAKRRKFDLVISDYGRPGGDGLEFLREFKARYPQTPVIMHTAQVARIRQRARRLGASACLQKMISSPGLRIIDRVLSSTSPWGRNGSALGVLPRQISPCRASA